MRALDWVKRFSNRTARTPKEESFHILAITVSDSIRTTLSRVTGGSNLRLCLAASSEEAIDLLATIRFPIILYDRDLDSPDWREALQRLAKAEPSTCILLASPVVDDYLWQEVVLHGGYDVLMKPLKDDAVAHSIDQALLYWHATTR